MKKIVFLTGSGISAESGIPTFRMAGDALWENVKVEDVCTHGAWEKNPDFVNKFYNERRLKYSSVEPNTAHRLIADLESEYEVVVITQNVDNLHEKAGSSNVLHLHGEIMKCCSEANPEDQSCWLDLPQPEFGRYGVEIPDGQKAADGSRLRPYIVFFDEYVPNIPKAEEIVRTADILVIIGTSLNVYPAAGIIYEFDVKKPLYIIDPWEDIEEQIIIENEPTVHICKTATEGMKDLVKILKENK